MFMCSGYIISFSCPIMQICMCECLEIIGVCFLVNMLSLEKLDVPVLENECFSFCGFADKTGSSGFPNQTVRF
jgi:hypothetical protein